MVLSAGMAASLQMYIGGIGEIADKNGVQQRQLFARSERVKGIDFHATEPWVSFDDNPRKGLTMLILL